MGCDFFTKVLENKNFKKPSHVYILKILWRTMVHEIIVTKLMIIAATWQTK